MKKHAFRIGLVVTMLLGLMTISANAAECTGDHTGATEWSGTMTTAPEITAGGTYVLTADVTCPDITVPAGDAVTICLKGYTLYSTSTNMAITVSAGATLNLVDCVGTGTVTPDPGVANSRGVLVKGIFNMYGGNITGFTSPTNRDAGGVYINGSDCTFNMYNGKITNNKCQRTTLGHGGGGVWMAQNSTFNMYGGEISGNSAQSGGGVYMGGSGSGSKFTMSGGTITGNFATGTSSFGGGGVFVRYGTMTMTDGTISNNDSKGQGGAIRVASGTVNISGEECTFSGNTTSSGAAIHNASGKVTITNGIYDWDVSSLLDTAVYTAYPTDEGTYDVMLIEDIPVADDGEDIHGDGDKTWYEYIPGTTTIEVGKKYYLNADYDKVDPIVISATTTLCLHGHTLKSNANGAFALDINNGATVTLQDCDVNTTDGTLTPDAEGLGSRGIIVRNGDLIMTGGIITGFEGTADLQGGGVYVYNGTFTMSGGSITGNAASEGKNGGGVYVASNSTFTLSGTALIDDNDAVDGGGVYAAGTFTMDGGTISNNTASGNGGGVIVSSGKTFTMNGGTISGNSAVNAGGVRFAGTMNMNGGYIYANTASGAGPGVQGLGTFTMTGGSIGLDSSDEAASNTMTGTDFGGLAVRCGTGGKATISGGKFYCQEVEGKAVSTFSGDVTVSAAQMNKKPGDDFIAADCMIYTVTDDETLIYAVAAKFAPHKAVAVVGTDMRLRFLITTAKIPGSYADDYTVTIDGADVGKLAQNGSTTVKFEHVFYAKNMTDEFTVIIKNGENTVHEANYSVQDYITSSMSDSALSPSEKNAVKYLVNYGAAAQTYFNHNTEKLISAGVEDLPELAWTAPEDTSEMYNLDADTARLYLGSSLSLKEQVKLNLYFADTVTKVTVGGKEHTPVNGVVTISPSLKNALKKLEIVISTDGAEDVTIYDSIQAYAYRATKLTDTDANLANLCQAMMDLVTFANENL